MKTLISLLLAVLASTAGAKDLNINLQRNLQTEEFKHVLVRTHHCMVSAIKAMLMQGVKDRDVIQNFGAQMCRAEFASFLQAFPPAEPIDVDEAMQTLAKLTMDGFIKRNQGN